MNPLQNSCLVLGASSQLGESVLPLLLEAGYEVHAASRVAQSETPASPQLHWHTLDLTSVQRWPVAVSLLVHLAPLYKLPKLLRQAPAPLRVVAVGSTSIRTKQDSPSSAERQMAQRLLQAEQEIKQICQSNGHTLTILRPTMLYGLGRDATIGRMQKFAQRWGFLPVPGISTGLRQPVHVHDISQAIMQVINAPRSYAKTYELGGRDTLSVRQLAERILMDNQQSVRIIPIPLWLLRLIFSLLKLVHPRLDWSPALLKRAALDQVVNNQAAMDDFGYAPRAFHARLSSQQKRD
ncbi:MAG TPA: NAD-dependent epimerase/dehydratase family protein [Thiopseudomonas sp.]|nr:NAD-dependent epimerase/dehydratase family protein [Thiopseudomonas sp.]